MEEKSFFQVLEERRSVRSFNNTEVDTALIKKIIEVCDLSPSAGGLQSFEIYNVDNTGVKTDCQSSDGSGVYCRSTCTFSFLC